MNREKSRTQQIKQRQQKTREELNRTLISNRLCNNLRPNSLQKYPIHRVTHSQGSYYSQHTQAEKPEPVLQKQSRNKKPPADKQAWKDVTSGLLDYVETQDKSVEDAVGLNKTSKEVEEHATNSYVHNMIENPGPLADLPNNPAANFAGGKYNPITLREDLILYRAGEAGGGQNALGQWFTREPAKSVAQVRIDLAVKPQWKSVDGVLTGSSPIESVYKIKIPKSTTIYEGPVGNQGESYLGGQHVMQIYVNKPWNIKGLQIMGESKIEPN